MTANRIKIYNRETIHQLLWPKTEWSEKVREFITPFVEHGPAHFINNISLNMNLLAIDDLVLPLVISETRGGNSYVCSPYCHYVTYGEEEVKSLSNPLLRGTLQALISLFGKLLSYTSIDKNVFINNWLMPTNLYPSITKDQINTITDRLIALYPNHAILFRSINSLSTKDLYNTLKDQGFRFVISRSVYFTDTRDDNSFKSRMFKSDLKVLSSSAYKIVEDPKLLEGSVTRIKDLYSALNITKHSKCNPQYNDNFIRHALGTSFLKLKGLEHSHSIDAVFGYFENNGIMTSPFFGYDTEKSSNLGLYRLISTKLLQEAREKKMLLHQSSGAGNYKKLRRAQEHIEYTAVYDKHLGFKRKFGWRLLEYSMGTLGKQYIKQYE